MSIKDVFKAIGRALGHVFSHKRAELFEDLLPLARPVVEAVFHVDVNGDGAIATTDEIEEGAKSIGGEIFKELMQPGGEVNRELVEAMPTSVRKRWLAITRFARVLTSAGIAIPSLGRVETIIQLAYEVLDDSRESAKAKA